MGFGREPFCACAHLRLAGSQEGSRRCDRLLLWQRRMATRRASHPEHDAVAAAYPHCQRRRGYHIGAPHVREVSLQLALDGGAAANLPQATRAHKCLALCKAALCIPKDEGFPGQKMCMERGSHAGMRSGCGPNQILPNPHTLERINQPLPSENLSMP